MFNPSFFETDVKRLLKLVISENSDFVVSELVAGSGTSVSKPQLVNKLKTTIIMGETGHNLKRAQYF